MEFIFLSDFSWSAVNNIYSKTRTVYQKKCIDRFNVQQWVSPLEAKRNVISYKPWRNMAHFIQHLNIYLITCGTLQKIKGMLQVMATYITVCFSIRSLVKFIYGVYKNAHVLEINNIMVVTSTVYKIDALCTCWHIGWYYYTALVVLLTLCLSS